MNNQNYLTVSEASKLTGKSEGTIRILLKELVQVYLRDPHTCTSLLVQVKGDNKRKFYKISEEVLLNRINNTITNTYISKDETFNNTYASSPETIKSTYTSTNSEQEILLLQNWLNDKDLTIEDLKKRLDVRDVEVARIHDLLENQQKISLHTQMLLDKNMIQLEAKIEANKVKERKKFLGLF
jgi:hypothetical protein